MRVVLTASLFTAVFLAATVLPRHGIRRSHASARRATGLEGDFADPFVLSTRDGYYAYATGTRGSHLQVARSRDLDRWTRAADPLPALPAWARDEAGLTWAPSVLPRPGGYVLYYTTRDRRSGFQCISAARGARPEGPYLDRSTRPLVCQVEADAALCGSIDPSPFVDGAGAAYLLWKSDENSQRCRTAPRIWSQALSADGLSLVGRPAALLARDRDWEGDIVEAPSMAVHDGRTFLFYSANWYASSRYAVGYATCAGPLGPCQKVTVAAPLLGSAGAALGPGGQELFTGPDGTLWMAYHAWTAPRTDYAHGGARSLRLARVGFDARGPALAPRP
jgi:beta-xylosidase